MRVVQTADLQGSVQPEERPGIGGQGIRNDHGAVFGDGDEAGVERGVEVRPKEQAVEHVEPLGVAFTVGPRLDVARSQEIGHGESGDRATAVPVLEESTTKDVLAHPLDDQALGLRRPWQAGGLGLEEVKQLVGQGARELERPAQQAMEGGDLRNAPRASRAAREGGW